MSPRHTQLQRPWLILLCTLTFGLLHACQPQEVTGGGFVIQNPEGERAYFVDFGSVVTGTTVSHVFEIKNTDTAPITIKDMTPSCSCTTPRVWYTDASGKKVRGQIVGQPILSIPPGVVANVVVEINTNHVPRKNVDKLAMVVLRCDSPNTPFMSFEMHLIASQEFQVTPKIMNLGDIPISSGSRASVDIVTAIPGGRNRLVGVESQSAGLEVSLLEEPVAGETLWKVEAVLSPPLTLGPFSAELALRTTDSAGEGAGEPLVIAVRGNVVPDVVVFPPALAVTALKDGKSVQTTGVLTALAAGHRVRIVDALLQGGYPKELQLEYTPQAPDSLGRSGRWDVTLSATSEQAFEAFAGSVQFTLEDPTAAVVEVKFIYRP